LAGLAKPPVEWDTQWVYLASQGPWRGHATGPAFGINRLQPSALFFIFCRHFELEAKKDIEKDDKMFGCI
jgi:hypothetical protein